MTNSRVNWSPIIPFDIFKKNRLIKATPENLRQEDFGKTFVTHVKFLLSSLYSLKRFIQIKYVGMMIKNIPGDGRPRTAMRHNNHIPPGSHAW